MLRYRWLALSSLVLGFAALVGCGKGEGSSATKPVTGTLNYKGAGLPNVVVTFMPEKGRPATGETDAAGKFTLTTDKKNDGAVLGKHKVTLSVKSTAPVPMPGTQEAANYTPPPLPFPQKYRSAETSDLEFEVKAGSNTAPLELKD